MSKGLKRWGSIVLICLLLVTVAVVLLRRWSTGAATGTVHVGSTSTDQAAQPQGPVDVKTSYFTTLLPAGFNIKTQAETPQAEPLQLRLVAEGGLNNQIQFAATVGTMPSDGLSGIGDYHLRTAQSTAYTPFTPPSLPAGAVAFRTASGPASFVVFWPHGTHYAEIALSTDSLTLDQLQSTWLQAIGSWSWL